MTPPGGSPQARVRPAVTGDAEGLARLELDAADRDRAGGVGVAAPGADLGPGGRRDDQLARRWVERLQLPAGDDHFVLAADDAGGLVGFASAGGSRDGDGKGDGELYALVVAPRGGILAGVSLARGVVVRLNQAGYARVTCWVEARELAAPSPVVTALARIGFAPDGAPAMPGTTMLRLVRPLRRGPRP